MVEGYREVRRALEKGVALSELYYSPEWFLGENEPALIQQAAAAGARLFELNKEAFAKVGVEAKSSSADELMKRLTTDIKKWDDVMKKAGIEKK